jgi:hypothetical protein
VGSDCTSSNGALLHAAPSRRRGRLAVICRRSVKVWRVVPTVLGVFCPLMIAERLPADPPSIFGITRRTSPSCHHTSGFLLPCTCLSMTGCPLLFALAILFSLCSARVTAKLIRLDAIHWHGYVFIHQCIPHQLLQPHSGKLQKDIHHHFHILFQGRPLNVLFVTEQGTI